LIAHLCSLMGRGDRAGADDLVFPQLFEFRE
jgi:hypothetical protein